MSGTSYEENYPQYPACPGCGSTDYSVMYFGDGTMIARDDWCGCDICMTSMSAAEYWEREMEDAKYDFEENYKGEHLD